MMLKQKKWNRTSYQYHWIYLIENNGEHWRIRKSWVLLMMFIAISMLVLLKSTLCWNMNMNFSNIFPHMAVIT